MLIKSTFADSDKFWLWDFAYADESGQKYQLKQFELEAILLNGVLDAKHIECSTAFKSCALVMTHTDGDKILFTYLKRNTDGSGLTIHKISRWNKVNNQRFVHTFEHNTADSEIITHFFAVHEFDGDNVGGSLGNVRSAQSIIELGFDEVESHWYYLTLNQLAYVGYYEEFSIPLSQVKSNDDIWFEVASPTEFVLYLSEMDYDAPFLHEDWYGTCSIPAASEFDEIFYEIKGYTAGADSAVAFEFDATKAQMTSLSCPDRVIKTSLRIEDYLGEFPIQQLIDSGLIETKVDDFAVEFYKERQDDELYKQRQEIFGEEYNEAALTFVYDIYQSKTYTNSANLG